MTKRSSGFLAIVALVGACTTIGCSGGEWGQATGEDENRTTTGQELSGSVASGSVPANLPSRLGVGLFEEKGSTWMKSSGVKWDYRYAYFVKGWMNNWGYSANDGSFARDYMNECDAQGFIPAAQFYVMDGESPAGDQSQFYQKTQNASTMAEYFTEVKAFFQQAKAFGKPVLFLEEADGFGFLEQQAGSPTAYAAVAATGLPELAGLPNTVAGWGLAFLQLRKSVGASNVSLGIHVSGWAGGQDVAYGSVTDPLQPQVDKVYAFLGPMGIAANVTGATYDLLVGDPLDRDSDYYKLVQGDDRWWDASDTASINSKSFNRYAEWLRLWNVKSQLRWVLWQIPLGNSNNLDVANADQARGGYKDNRTEYFFGASESAHLAKFADVGVVALLFGRGDGDQANYDNDVFTDGQPYLKTHAGALLNAGGFAIARSSAGSAPADAGAPAVDAARADSGPTGQDSGTPRDAGGGSADAGSTVDAGGGAADAGGGRADAGGGAVDAGGGSADAGGVPVDAGGGAVDAGSGAADGGTKPDAGGPPPPSDPSTYNFETGIQGWQSDTGLVKSLVSSTAQASAGTHALAVTFGGGAGQGSAFVANPTTAAGKTVTFHVFCPAGSKVTSVQPFVLQGAAGKWARTGSWTAMSSLKAGTWNTMTVTVPATAKPLAELGVQFTIGSAWAGTCYVDAVTW